jgi:gluconate 2-dehydrogenase gamma chain
MTDGKTIARRKFLAGAGAAGTAAAAVTFPLRSEAAVAQAATVAASGPAAAAAAAPVPEPLLALNATEAAFIQAAVDTLIPADDLTGSGSDCGVATFIDRQLAGAWGNGARLYRSGPFLKGKPEHGYQLALTPLEFFRAGIAAANAWSRTAHGKDFDRLSAADRDVAMREIESGKAEFAHLSAKDFFEALLLVTMEGFFSDPMYGGNRDMAAWKMIGYPGLPATYAEKIEQYRGKRYDGAPQSIADFS